MPIQQIMDPYEGHAEHQFDVEDFVSLKEAEKRFKELTGRGFSAVEPGRNGKVGRRLDKFDPTVPETIFIPALQSG